MSKLYMGFVIGVISFLAYKYNIIDLLSDGVSHHEVEETITLLEINMTEAEENFDKVAQDLVSDFQRIGFAVVSDIKDFDADELLEWTKWFFNLKLSCKFSIAKKAFNTTSPSMYRGYYPIVPGTHSFKEAFEMGSFNREYVPRKTPLPEDLRNITTNKDGRLYMRNIVEEKNVFPVTDDEAKDLTFMKVMLKYYKIYENLGDTILKLMHVGLGIRSETFLDSFGDNALSTFRLLHYPTRLSNPSSIPADAWDGDQAMVTGAHFDTSVLTILATFNTSGLQIRPPGYTKWFDLNADKNKLLINIGSLLAYMVDGKMIATDHRVVDTGVDRYSVPYFYEPRFDADLSKTLYGNVNEFVGKYITYGPWMTNRTSQFYEYASTDFGVVE